MNRYGFIIGDDGVKNATKRKVETIKKQTIKKFGKGSIRDKVLATPARRVPAPRIRGQRCLICNIRVPLLTGIGMCMGCEARMTRIERGTEESMLPQFLLILPLVIMLIFVIAMKVK